MNRKPRSVACFRPAFTLVEMLVVITIIAILASLITVAANNALYSSKNTQIKVEVDQLAEKMELFKSKYGSYPPCDLRVNDPVAGPRLHQFVSKAWPRYNQSNLATELTSSGVDTANFHPDQALVFWLSGFSADVTNPFIGPGGPGDTTGAAKQPIAEFDQARLWPPTGIAKPGGQSYLPPLSGITQYVAGARMPVPPYVYFDYANYGVLPSPGSLTFTTSPASPNPPFFDGRIYVLGGTAGLAWAYMRDANGNGVVDLGETWANPTSFQIICAGQDKAYSTSYDATYDPTKTATPLPVLLYPTGIGYDTGGAHNDNITNFLSGVNSLEHAKP